MLGDRCQLLSRILYIIFVAVNIWICGVYIITFQHQKGENEMQQRKTKSLTISFQKATDNHFNASSIFFAYTKWSNITHTLQLQYEKYFFLYYVSLHILCGAITQDNYSCELYGTINECEKQVFCWVFFAVCSEYVKHRNWHHLVGRFDQLLIRVHWLNTHWTMNTWKKLFAKKTL